MSQQLTLPRKYSWPAVSLTFVMLVMASVTVLSLSLAWSVLQNNKAAAESNDGKPVGTSIKGYWTTAPQGYLIEDGSAVSRTTYAALFSVIGTTFGAGDGSTTFNLPDSRGKVTVNQSTTESEFNTLGETGGEKTHALTTGEMPAHDHGITGQTIAWGASVGTVRFREWHQPDPGNGNNQDSIIAIGGASPAITNAMYTINNGADGWSDTYNAGSGAAHNNLQPYITINRAIKYQ